MSKKCSSDREKLLKFEAEGRDFAKILRSLELSSRFLTRTVHSKNLEEKDGQTRVRRSVSP